MCGWINARKVAQFWKVEGRLNGVGYISILESIVFPTIHSLEIPAGWTFQQDNDTCHTYLLVKV